MKKYVMIAMAVLGMASCSEQKFHVEGQITEAEDSVLYLENVGISELNVIDSVKLSSDGKFSFSGEATEAPEFYRLRISDQIINIAIDSTETVTVKASYPKMATGYEVTGSENCQKIKELALKQMDLQRKAILISSDEALTVDESNDSILGLIQQYKDEVKRQYIFPAPDKSYAYFALFQTMGNMLLFNPRTDKEDIKVFAAVATSWDTHYPNAERGANLHNIAIEGMKNVRINEANQAAAIDPSKVQTAGVIEIALADNNGKVRRLTDLKGKVVLLDFHVFATNESPARILLLRELYNKYHEAGLEIYQVGLNGDAHWWRQSVESLPWVNVIDPSGASAARYNVQSLGEFFVIDRSNTLQHRVGNFAELEKLITKYL